MLKKIKNIAMALALVATFSAPVLVPVGVSADIADQVCLGSQKASSDPAACNTTGDGSQQIGNVAKKAVDLISLVVGVIAVIMIIFGGFKYITSGGESSNVSGAKNTLIYAIVGLIIVALAQFIVRFVLGTASGIN